MPRHGDVSNAEYESQIQAAIDAFSSQQLPSLRAVAAAFKIPRTTLIARLNGREPRNKSHEYDQLLTHAEEKELVRHITQLIITGYSPRYAMVRELAEEIRKKRVSQINDSSMILVEYPAIGQKWVSRFIKRHSQLQSVIGQRIDVCRVKDTTLDKLTSWFNALESVIEEFDILPENTYNMDESGFSIGTMETSRVIINAKVRRRLQAQPGRQEWVTSIECICASGEAIDPFIIFRGENTSAHWISDNTPDSWRVACNSKGWTSNTHGLDWLCSCFEPATREKANGQWRLLICDGHDSHITGAFITYCMDNHIHLMVLPPHTSHSTQPLDVGIFGPLKKAMASELAPIIGTQIGRPQKAEWLEAFVNAHHKVFKRSNILGGFHGTVIHPFYLDIVLKQYRNESTPTTPISMSTRFTTPPPTTLFTEAILTSSPHDIVAVRNAGLSICAQLDAITPLETPARTFVKCLTRGFERLHTRNTILQREKDKVDAVVKGRNTRESGKRGIIKGKYLLTVAEIRDRIVAAELETAARKVKKPHKSQSAIPDTGVQSSDDIPIDPALEMEGLAVD